MDDNHKLCKLCNQRYQAVTATHMITWHTNPPWYLCPRHLDLVKRTIIGHLVYGSQEYEITTLMNRVV